MSNKIIKISPAPWKLIGKGRLILVDKDNKHIATVWDNPDGKDEANALLLKSAPRMLMLICEIFNEIELDELPIKDRPKTYLKILQLLRDLAWEAEE